jgi:hypothetical protein
MVAGVLGLVLSFFWLNTAGRRRDVVVEDRRYVP